MKLPTLVEKKFPKSLVNLLETEIVFNEEKKKQHTIASLHAFSQ
jgi:hypothetical protein